jgi:hypothetical protein
MRLLITSCYYNSQRSDDTHCSDYQPVFTTKDIDAEEDREIRLRTRHLDVDGTYKRAFGPEYPKHNSSKMGSPWRLSAEERFDLWEEQWVLIYDKINWTDCDDNMTFAIRAAMAYLEEEDDPERHGLAIWQAAKDFGIETSDLASAMAKRRQKAHRVRALKGFAPRGGSDGFYMWNCQILDLFDGKRIIPIPTRYLKEDPEVDVENFINTNTVETLRLQRELGLGLGRQGWTLCEAIDAWGQGLFNRFLMIPQLWGFPILEKEWSKKESPFLNDYDDGSMIHLGYPYYSDMNWLEGENYWSTVSLEKVVEVFIRTCISKSFPLQKTLLARREEIMKIKLPQFENDRLKKVSGRYSEYKFSKEHSTSASICGMDTTSLLTQAYRYVFDEPEPEHEDIFPVKQKKQKKEKIVEEDSRNLFADTDNPV